ncbi:MAG TPA: glycosyltransferase family 2 protein [Candidatus Omnitrophota bacterium]|nr:glycosyltransferase family 2 protein [Candidatus Omnitrophota bacterium]
MKILPITAIVLTYNEEANLEACLQSLAGRVETVLVVDSFSTDRTVDISRSVGAVVHQHEFSTQACQFNWALDNLKVGSDWVLRLDADERMTDELWGEIEKNLERAKGDIGGFILNRRLHFMGKWIRHGGCYPIRLLRLFRKGMARSEDRAMDEHLVLLEGRAVTLKKDFIHENRKSLYWWTDKHNDYSTREMKIIVGDEKSGDLRPGVSGGQAAGKRWLKGNLYLRLPLFVRAGLYFSYRYFIRLGFMDGCPGLVYHFLQAMWYRFLVDAKVYERTIAEREKSK